MQVRQVEDDTMGEVVEGEVVVEEALTRVDHADVVELLFVHGLERGNFHVDALKVEFCGGIGFHASKLGTSATARNKRCRKDVRLVRRSSHCGHSPSEWTRRRHMIR